MSASSEQARRKFHTLDGMRGVAAILVVARHGMQFVAPLDFPNSFLAVDLFFMLSGFVIAAAYDGRLDTGRLTPVRFMLVRFIRLWPLYLLGTLLVSAIVYSKILHGKSDLDLMTFWRALPGQLVMLPSPFTKDLYTVNPVAWSLCFELVINAAYAFFHRWLNTVTLAIITTISVLALISAQHFQPDGISTGWAWSHAGVAFARVGFAFPVGVLLYRYRARLPRLGLPPILVLVLLVAILTAHLPGIYNDTLQMLAIVVVFPFLVTAAVEVEPSSRLVPSFTWLGVTSYAVYTLHYPLLTFFDYGLAKIGLVFSDYSPWSGLVGIVVITLVAWIADRIYDVPLRAWLTERTRGGSTLAAGRREPIAR